MKAAGTSVDARAFFVLGRLYAEAGRRRPRVDGYRDRKAINSALYALGAEQRYGAAPAWADVSGERRAWIRAELGAYPEAVEQLDAAIKYIESEGGVR